MPTRPRRVVVSDSSSPLSDVSPLPPPKPVEPSDVANADQEQRPRKKLKKTANNFSGFHSAFEATTSDAPTATRTSAVKREPGPSKTRRKLQDGISASTCAPTATPTSSAKRPSLGIPTDVNPTGQVIVIDDSDGEAEVVKKRPRKTTASRKASIEDISSDEHVLPSKGKAKQRSTAPSSNAKTVAIHGAEQEVEQAMWCDAYAPMSTADLAPSKTRVQSVRSWLEEALYGRPSSVDQDIPFSQLARDRIRKYRRILVLSGPAGVGKTTTLKLVAKELNVQVVEWEEGAEEWSMGGQIDRESMNSKFVGFLSRSAYQSLKLAGPPGTSKDHQPETADPASSKPSKILLITSLPNLSHLPTRQTFQQALLDYTKSFTSTSCPLVIIVPDAGSSGAAEESWIGTSSGNDAAWDLRTVLGKDLTVNPAVRVVEFLPMAPTFLVKALKRISALAFPDAKSRPSQDTIQLIAHTANGDLRSAINSLQFLSRSGESGNGLNAKATGPRIKASGKGSRGGKGAKLNSSEEVKKLLNAVARREQSLGLFHALGKVLYNKRVGDPAEDGGKNAESSAKDEESLPKSDPLPAHLAHHERPRYENDIDMLVASVPVDTATFMLWLHQNLPPFCSQIEQVDEAYEDMCRADLMRADDDLWQRSPHAIAYAFNVAVRGALNGLPHPVPRNHQKLVKPQFFEYLRNRRERQEAIDAGAKWMMSRNLARVAAAANGNAGDDNDEHGHWGGLPSQSALATEYMPCFRVLKKTGIAVPSAVVPEGDEAFMTFDDDGPTLEVLTEQEGVPYDDEYGDIDVEDATTFTVPRTRPASGSQPLPAEEEMEPAEAVSWLEEDDIEEE